MNTKLIAVLFGINAISALAFQSATGSACEGTGACSYQYIPAGGSENSTVTVNGWCAPNGVCADNGALCETSDNCYDYCATSGTKKVCGGLGAACNSQEAFVSAQLVFACNTPGYVCSTNGAGGEQGTCLLAASQAARVKSRRATHQAVSRDLGKIEMLRRAAKVVARAGDETLA